MSGESSRSVKQFLVHGLTTPLRYVARFQGWLGDTVQRIPGWQEVEAAAAQVTWPLRAIASATLRRFPVLRRAEWLLETERLSSYPPVLLAGTLLLMTYRGLQTTRLGHIGSDLLIYPLLATVSGFNPFLGCMCALCFGAGDLVQKLIVNDIFGTPQDLIGHYFNLDYWGSIVGYTFAYASPAVMGLVPGISSRIARQAVRLTLRRVFYRRAAAAADGVPRDANAAWQMFARRRGDGSVEWATNTAHPGGDWIAQGPPITRDEAEAALEGLQSGELDAPPMQTTQAIADDFGRGTTPPRTTLGIGHAARIPDGREVIGLASAVSPVASPPSAATQGGPWAPNYKDPKVQDALRGLRDKGLLTDPDAWRSFRDADGNALTWREKQILGHLRGRRLLREGNEATIDRLAGGDSGAAVPPSLNPYEPDGSGPSYPVAELAASFAGAMLGATAVMKVAAPVLEASAFYTRPHPDYSCFALEKRTYLDGRGGTVGFTGAVGGNTVEVLAKPVRGGGGGGAPARPAPPIADDRASVNPNVPSEREQIEDLRRRRARNQFDIDQANQNLDEINRRLAGLTPEERRQLEDPDSSWGRDIKARIAQNEQQKSDAKAAQNWTDDQLKDLHASGEGGDSGYGPIHRGGVGRDVEHDLTRQRIEDEDKRLRKKYEDWVHYSEEHSSLTPDGHSRAGRIIDRTDISNPDGTINKDALGHLIDELKGERRATGVITNAEHEHIGAWWDHTIATTTLVRDAGMSIGLGGAGLAGAAIPSAFTAAGATFNGLVGAVTGYSETGSFHGTVKGAVGGIFLGGVMEKVGGFVIKKAPILGSEIKLGTDAERAWLAGKTNMGGSPAVKRGPAPLEAEAGAGNDSASLEEAMRNRIKTRRRLERELQSDPTNEALADRLRAASDQHVDGQFGEHLADEFVTDPTSPMWKGRNITAKKVFDAKLSNVAKNGNSGGTGFDGVHEYVDPATGETRYLITDAKVRSAQLRNKVLPDGRVYKQGSQEWTEDVLGRMANGSPHDQAVAKQLRQALKNGKVDFMEFSAKPTAKTGEWKCSYDMGPVQPGATTPGPKSHVKLSVKGKFASGGDQDIGDIFD